MRDMFCVYLFLIIMVNHDFHYHYQSNVSNKMLIIVVTLFLIDRYYFLRLQYRVSLLILRPGVHVSGYQSSPSNQQKSSAYHPEHLTCRSLWIFQSKNFYFMLMTNYLLMLSEFDMVIPWVNSVSFFLWCPGPSVCLAQLMLFCHHLQLAFEILQNQSRFLFVFDRVS